jgi:hypothetical protein
VSTCLEHASKSQDKTRTGTDEKDGGYIEAKSNGGVGNEHEWADASEFEKWRKTLCEGQDGEIDEGTDGRVIVQRDEWVHLETV